MEKLINGYIEMSSQQVRAAEILLRKSLPDLQTIECEHRGNSDNPVSLILQDMDDGLPF